MNEQLINVVEIPHSDNKFLQQRIPGCKPFLTPMAGAVILFMFSIITVTPAIFLLITTKNMKKFEFDYTEFSEINITTKITIPEDMHGNIWIYYKIKAFYQNSFIYSSSKSYDQLFGVPYHKASTKLCDSVEFADDDHTKKYMPCGAVPKSIFNDTFFFDHNFPKIRRTDITPKNYIKPMKPIDSSYNTNNSVFVLDENKFPGGFKNEDFINWMLISPFPTFKKTWGKLDTNLLKSGTYEILISNNYPVKSFGGHKSLVIEEVRWFGGNNIIAAYLLLAMTALSFIFGIVCLILSITNSMPVYRFVNIQRTASTMSLIQ